MCHIVSRTPAASDNANNPPHVDEQNLRASMNRFFLKFPVDKPVTRNNYFLQIVQPKTTTSAQDSTYPTSGSTPINSTGLNAKLYDEAYQPIDPEELAWSATTNGPEDEYRPGHAHQPPEGKPLIVTPETLRMRTERQTLRRLPGSGAIVFGIRTYVWEIEKIKEEVEEVGEGKRESVAERFASAIRGWPEQVRTYKVSGVGLLEVGSMLIVGRERLCMRMCWCRIWKVSRKTEVIEYVVLSRASVAHACHMFDCPGVI